MPNVEDRQKQKKRIVILVVAARHAVGVLRIEDEFYFSSWRSFR